MTNKKELEMYNKEVKIIFYPDSHRYKLDGEKTYLISSTSATKHVDKAEALKGWVSKLWAQFLYEKVGEQEVFYPVQLEEIIEDAKTHWVDMQEKAKDVGSEVHNFVEEFTKAKIKGEEYKPNIKQMDEGSKQGIYAFLKWYTENDIEFIEAERMVYSKQHGYVGTLDVILRYNGKLAVGDYKTSKGIYTDHYYQLSSYNKAYAEEMRYTLPKKEAAKRIPEIGLIMHFNKETGEFDVKEVSLREMQKDFKAFKGCLEVQKREKERSRYKS